MPLHNPENLAPYTPAVGTYLVEGGEVVYSGVGYVYNVLGGWGYIDGVPVSWVAQDVTLDPADATLDRIDAFTVDAAGVIAAVTGTPSIAPNKPAVDPALLLELSFALVTANTTEPGDTATTYLYRENAGQPTEWAMSTSNGGAVVFGSATNPRGAGVCIRATSAPAGTTLTFTAAAAIDPRDFDIFVLFIRLASQWNSKASLRLQWRLGGANVGNPVVVKPGQNGLLNDTTSYQGQAWLIPEFAFPVGATVDRLVVTVTGAAVSFGLDDVQLQHYGSDLVPVGDDDPNLSVRSVAITLPVSATGIVPGDMVWELSGVVEGWQLVSDVPGAVKLDIWRTPFANFDNTAHPVDADSICAGHEPEIVGPAGNKAEAADVTNWARYTVAPGDIWRFNVDSVTAIGWVTLGLKVRV